MKVLQKAEDGARAFAKSFIPECGLCMKVLQKAEDGARVFAVFVFNT